MVDELVKLLDQPMPGLEGARERSSRITWHLFGLLPHLVGQRLPWPRDVAVSLGLREDGVDIVLAHVGDHLVARPPLSWMPVSTTSRTARNSSELSRP